MAGFYDRLQAELKKRNALTDLFNQVKQRVLGADSSPAAAAAPAVAVGGSGSTPAEIAVQRLEAMASVQTDEEADSRASDSVHATTSSAATQKEPEPDGAASQDDDAADDDLTHRLNVSILDLIASRDELERRLKDSEARVLALRQDVAALRAERDNLEQQIQLNNQEIERLTQLYTDQLIKYDQLNEDTQEMRLAMRREISQLHQELETRKLKLNDLTQEFTEYRAQADALLENYREQLRESRAGYEELKRRYEAIRQENERLVNRISGFAYELMAEISGKFVEAEMPPLEERAFGNSALEDAAASIDAEDSELDRRVSDS